MIAISAALAEKGALPSVSLKRLPADRRHLVADTNRARRGATVPAVPTRQDLLQALQAQDQALVALAHDVKNALCCVGVYAQLLERQVSALQKQSSTEAGGPQAALMRNRLERMKRIVARTVVTLDAAVHTSGAQRPRTTHRRTTSVPQRKGTDLVELVQRALRESTLSDHRQDVVFVASTPQLHGVWDEVSLGRVLDNLFSNAEKYGPQGGTVTVAVDIEHSTSGAVAAISVTDVGIGIPLTDLPHLFEWTFRASNVGDVPGTGVGLAASSEIVERLGGSISVTSKEGTGSTFTVRLPITP